MSTVEQTSFTRAYRDACRRAGAAGAWTWTASTVTCEVLACLAEVDEALGGTELARRIGRDPANMTTRTLPRLAELGLLDWDLGESARPGAKVPRVWWLTETGRHLAALAEDEEIR